MPSTTTPPSPPSPTPDAVVAVVVVPDGLAAGGIPRRTLPEPSFAFRAVLDHVAARYATQRVWVAPANAFGGPRSEQDVAADYLRARGMAHVFAPPSPSPSSGYIDTRANAELLRAHLEDAGEWPLGGVILAVSAPHARRAHLCFANEGFKVAQVDAVRFAVVPGEPIVPRLWYYAHPLAHHAYEVLALIREYARGAALLRRSRRR